MRDIIAFMLILIFTACYGQADIAEKNKEAFVKELDEYFHQEKQQTEKLIYLGNKAKYSPDGKYIVFLVVIKNIEYIYLFDRKTERVIRGFWGNYNYCDGPVFNKNSKNLVFNTGYWINQEHTKSDFFLQTMDLEGNNREILLRPKQAAVNPVFSQGGDVIYFSEFLKDGDKLHYMNIKEKKDKILINKNVGQISEIVPLADASNIIFTAGGNPVFGGGNLYKYNIYSTELSEIKTREPVTLVYSDSYMDYAFIEMLDEKNKNNIYKINLISGELEILFHIKRKDANWHNDYSLSPDGKKIMYISTYSISTASITNLIMEVDIGGNGLRPLPINLRKINEVPVVDMDKNFDWKK